VRLLGRKKWLTSGFAVAGLCTAWWFWSSPAGGRFTRAQYDRIQFGMTRAEVEAIMGAPPGCYQEADHEYEGPVYEETEGDMGAAYQSLLASGVTPDGPDQFDWESDTFSVTVWFLNERAVQKLYTAPESKLHRRFMDGIDWLTGSPGPRPFRSVPRPATASNK
jgi:hypothetical protein